MVVDDKLPNHLEIPRSGRNKVLLGGMLFLNRLIDCERRLVRRYDFCGVGKYLLRAV